MSGDEFFVTALLGVAALAATVGGILLTLPSPNYRAAHLGFWCAACCFAASGMVWAVSSSDQTKVVRVGIAETATLISILVLAYVLSLVAPKPLPFSYFCLHASDPSHLSGPQYQRFVTSPHGMVEKLNYWISPFNAKRNGDMKAYMSIDKNKIGLQTFHGGGPFAWWHSYPLGDYLIEFDDSNGHWEQEFHIYKQNGELRQHVRVTNLEGTVLYESSDDANFSDP